MSNGSGFLRAIVMAFVGMLLITVGLSQQTLAQPTLCGDTDNNGVLQIQDLLIDIEYIFRGGAPPTDFDIADFDGRQLLTIADAQELWHCFFTCTFSSPGGTCPPSQPTLAPSLDPAIKIRYMNRIPTGATSLDLSLTLAGAPEYAAFTAPLSITINGAPAIIDSVTVPAPSSVFFGTTRSIGISSIDGPGIVRIGLFDAFSRSSALDVPAIVHLSVPVAASVSEVEVNWTTLSPAQAPTADSSVFPLFYKFLGDNGFVPTLQGFCCVVPGDANFDGEFNILDPVLLIGRIFGSGPPLPCSESADANGDNAANIADVTYGIARIFSGGPAPICGS